MTPREIIKIELEVLKELNKIGRLETEADIIEYIRISGEVLREKVKEFKEFKKIMQSVLEVS